MSVPRFALAATIWLLLGADDAAAQLHYQRMRFTERGEDLVVTTSYRELFDAQSVERLSSGLVTTIVVRIYVYRFADGAPVSTTVLRHRVVYDLWDETYVLQTEGPGGTSTKRFETRAEVLRQVTHLTRFPVARLAQIAMGPHYVAAAIYELNPLSAETLAEVRRWLTRSATESQQQSSSIFGSFVSLFANPRIDSADRMIRLRSQPFYRLPR